MANINEILARAAALREETALNSISPERAGGIMYDTLMALNELWLQQGAALVISKIYASVDAMEADTNPVSDISGKPLRTGQIVVIASEDEDNGSVYRYNGPDSPSWSLVGKIGNLEPVDSLDSDSTQLPLAAHQGKVLDGKISQLGQKVYATEIVSATSGRTPYDFIEGDEYIFESKGNNVVTLTFRDESDNILGNPFYLHANGSLTSIAPANAVKLGYGDACDLVLINKKSMFYALMQNRPLVVSKNFNDQMTRGYYINTAVQVGAVVDMTPVASSSSTGYVIIPCHKYDEFTISTYGGASARAICFVDKSYKCLTVSGSGATLTNFKTIASQDGYLIVNTSQWASGFNIDGEQSIQISDLYNKLSSFYTKDEVGRMFLETKMEFANSQVYNPYPFKAGKKYAIINLGNNAVTFSTRETSPSAGYVDVVIGYPFNAVVFTASGDANYLKAGDPASAIVCDLSSLSSRIDNLNAENGCFDELKASVDFAFEKDMQDVSTEVASVDFGEMRDGCYTIIEQVYAKFDELAQLYPDYVTKVDIAQELGLAYPQYASLNGQASGDYLATPSYKTYMYKLVSYNQYVNTGYQKKKKVFLVGGTHGDEIAAPFNLYLIAKRLCEATHEDYFKLRAAFDIYIIPCLNGYGIYHHTRVNADGVNINRNYPTKGWSVAGQGTEDYTGASAGSEFETKIVMGVVENYAPNMLIDHHNYARIPWQFYTEVCAAKLAHIVHKSLVDCSRTFIKNLPSYFGTAYKLFQENNESAPGTIALTSAKTTARWGYEVGVEFSSTIEISCTINYTNGIYDNNTVDRYYSPDVFKVGEFTLRNQLLHYGKYIMG